MEPLNATGVYTLFVRVMYANDHNIKMGEIPDDPRSKFLNTEKEILDNASKELLEMIFVAAKANPIDSCRDWAFGYETDITDDSNIAVKASNKNFNYEALNGFFGEEFFAREIFTDPYGASNGSLNGFQSNDINEDDYRRLTGLCKEALISRDSLEISNLVEYLKAVIRETKPAMADTEIPALNAWIKFKLEGSFNQP